MTTTFTIVGFLFLYLLWEAIDNHLEDKAHLEALRKSAEHWHRNHR